MGRVLPVWGGGNCVGNFHKNAQDFAEFMEYLVHNVDFCYRNQFLHKEIHILSYKFSNLSKLDSRKHE